ncbi:MAG: class I SAM-dependent methyltransferase [Anaerolineae bacterium]
MGSAAIQGELWSKAPHDWTHLQEPLHKPLWEAMLDAAQVGQYTSFLDAGCGGGGASILAFERGAIVSGLDAAEPLVRMASERVPGGDFRTGDIEQLPFRDASFDVVFAANSVQYAANRVAALRELKRVCTAGGRIVAGLFSTPEKVEYRAFFKAVRDSLPTPPPGDGPFGLSTPGILEGLMEQAGFRVLGHAEVSCPFYYEDFDTFWKANASAGPLQAALRSVSEDKLRANVEYGIMPLQQSDGTYLFKNMFRLVTGTVD